MKKSNNKKSWNVMCYGWIGAPSEGVDKKSGIRWYKPGDHMGWFLVRSFSSARAADEWLCNECREHGYSISDFTIKEA